MEEGKTITKENAVDIAWKTEGLVKVLEQRKDPRAEELKFAQLTALWDPRLVGVIPNLQSAEPTIEELETIYHIMEQLSNEFNYDSGKRKYGPIKS